LELDTIQIFEVVAEVKEQEVSLVSQERKERRALATTFLFPMGEQLYDLGRDGCSFRGLEIPPTLPIEVEHLMQDTRTLDCQWYGGQVSHGIFLYGEIDWLQLTPGAQSSTHRMISIANRFCSDRRAASSNFGVIATSRSPGHCPGGCGLDSRSLVEKCVEPSTPEIWFSARDCVLNRVVLKRGDIRFLCAHSDPCMRI
jgi:hypothetical protein